MTTIKIIGVLVSSLIAVCSAMFGVASAMSIGTSDERERRDAAISAFWSFLTLTICAAVIVTLAGCSEGRTIYHACREGLCR